ncbi:transcriptional regulator [Aeromonas hydrophila]|uniref:ogr/Delta-like zinc finger family protein n=1 Tax=Aeromonas hydrophila TaxID=644 RepID=UPI000A1EE766|nr:ogr/Delta-like zinc finger family protein [Aeromonas hydrophila]OSP49242.1 transcriptional regulator [Aeromonas hydrophila]
MRVFCKECGQRGRITKTNRLSDEVSDLYCQCTDAECGHSWVATLSFSHTLSPSSRATSQIVLDLFNALTPEKRELILSGLKIDQSPLFHLKQSSR